MEASPAAVSLSLSKYGYWFEAIIADDPENIRIILVTKDDKDKNILLNTRFDFQTDDDILGKIAKGIEFGFRRPFSISLILGTSEVAAELLRQGVDVTLLEDNGTNIIHQLVLFACSNQIPDAEDQSIDSYRSLCDFISRDTLKEMLMKEDDDGMRPIELAASKGSLELFRVIFQTPEIYLIRQETRGLLIYQWFDVTDYEQPVSISCKKTATRAGKSPLAFLAFMDEKVMERASTKDLFEWQPIKEWVNAKLICNYLPTLLWFFLRTSIALCFFVLVSDENRIRYVHQSRLLQQNSSGFCPGFSGVDMSNYQRNTLLSYTMVNALAILLFDVVDISTCLIKKSPYVLYKTSMKNGVAVEYKVFRICQVILAVLLTVLGVGFATGFAEVGSPIAYVLQLVASILACWSLLYFVQLLPSIGIFVVTVQRMLIDLVHFIVVFGMFIAPLAHFLLIFMNSDTTQGCIENYSSLSVTLYTSFTVMLNMEALRNYEVVNPGILYLLHVVFVFVIAVLLLNFLIANLSSSAARVYNNRELLVTLERLSIFHTVEFRFSRLLYIFYASRKRKAFTMKGDKFCVTNVTFITSSTRQ